MDAGTLDLGAIAWCRRVVDGHRQAWSAQQRLDGEEGANRQARNQEVTVRRPLAKRTPTNNRGRRRAERLCNQEASQEKVLVSNGGGCDNGMAGSLAGQR